MISRNDFYPEVNTSKAAVNELANKPRYDIDKRRYGNTLTDDMLAIKNPNYQGHTPESYSYFNEPVENQAVQPMTPAGGWGEVMGSIPKLEQNPVKEYMAANPYLKYGTTDHEARLFGRNKTVGEGTPLEAWRDDWTLEDDILEFPEAYTQEQIAWAENRRNEREAANRVASLGTEDLRSEKLGTYQDPEDWVSRRDSEIDSTVDTLVNYGALSPATIEQMAKMGVNKPVESNPDSDDAALYLNFLLNAYRRMNE